MLTEVKKYNAAHPGAHRTLQIRVMGGRHCPKWFEAAGVSYYDTTHPEKGNWNTPLRAPMPYDNPEFLKHLRDMYRALYDRYHDEPARRGAPDVIGSVIERDKFLQMRAEFYQHKGCDENGIPKPETLKRLGLDNLDKEPSRV